MTVEIFKKKNVAWVRALSNKNLSKHCAENKNEVTMSKYIATVESLIHAHGIAVIHRVRK